MISSGEESTLRQAVSMVLDRVFDRSGLPDAADRDRERPHVLDLIVPERAGGAGRIPVVGEVYGYMWVLKFMRNNQK